VYPLVPTQGSLFYSGGVFNYYPGVLLDYHKQKPKLRVAAYCRVSTDSDEQASSYEVQIEHYTEFIKKNSEWEFAGIFADDGISGTNTKKRDEFNRMIDECMAGKIDMIITKSISRFARNTLDCLQYIRKLKDKNIAVYFEKENINTLDAKGEIMLTIMASLAQQESQSLSQNVKLGYQYRYQQGEVMVNCSRFLGYTKDESHV
jgi:site-specific DNA recombinase